MRRIINGETWTFTQVENSKVSNHIRGEDYYTLYNVECDGKRCPNNSAVRIDITMIDMGLPLIFHNTSEEVHLSYYNPCVFTRDGDTYHIYAVATESENVKNIYRPSTLSDMKRFTKTYNGSYLIPYYYRWFVNDVEVCAYDSLGNLKSEYAHILKKKNINSFATHQKPDALLEFL